MTRVCDLKVVLQRERKTHNQCLCGLVSTASVLIVLPFALSSEVVDRFLVKLHDHKIPKPRASRREGEINHTRKDPLFGANQKEITTNLPPLRSRFLLDRTAQSTSKSSGDFFHAPPRPAPKFAGPPEAKLETIW